MNEIRGDARTVREVLGKKYTIDYYQREYKWGRKHVEELLTDLSTAFLQDYHEGDDRSEVAKYGHYFLGSIIVSKADESYIVDGQQRLTTLTLLLIYLNHLQGKSDTTLASLIYSQKFGARSFNIDVEERSDTMNALFEKGEFDAEAKPESVQNLVARYADVSELYPDELKGVALPYFIDWLIENVHLVEITAFSNDDAYTVFETMNDRGLSLSPIDHLKGYLLSNITDSKKRDAANDLWKERVQALGKDTDADFFKSWLRSQYARAIRARGSSQPEDFDKIGSEFHRWVRNNAKTLKLEKSEEFASFILRDFEFYSRQYLRMMKASEDVIPGLEYIYYNAQANLTLQPTLLLAPLLPGEEESVINFKWQIAAQYLDILVTRRIWNSKSTDQSTMRFPIFQIALAIRGKDAISLAQILYDDLQKQEESFNNTFALHGMNRRQVKRILARLTSFVELQSGQSNNYKEYTSGKKYEIEHIWADKPERHSPEFPHAADFESYRNRIGCLLLLPKSFNASYGAMEYGEKLQHYDSQNLLARSLGSNCYDHNPGFLKFLKESGLSFKSMTKFEKSELDERGSLYQRIADNVWNPTNILEAIKK